MSKIAEKRALEAYPICNCYNEQCMMQEDVNFESRIGYEKGYDQAIQDLLTDANQYMYLSDEIGYAYASGCRKTMQDFLEKAEKFFKNELYVSISDQICSHDSFTSMLNFIEQFKNYMQDESKN